MAAPVRPGDGHSVGPNRRPGCELSIWGVITELRQIMEESRNISGDNKGLGPILDNNLGLLHKSDHCQYSSFFSETDITGVDDSSYAHQLDESKKASPKQRF